MADPIRLPSGGAVNLFKADDSGRTGTRIGHIVITRDAANPNNVTAVFTRADGRVQTFQKDLSSGGKMSFGNAGTITIGADGHLNYTNTNAAMSAERIGPAPKPGPYVPPAAPTPPAAAPATPAAPAPAAATPAQPAPATPAAPAPAAMEAPRIISGGGNPDQTVIFQAPRRAQRPVSEEVARAQARARAAHPEWFGPDGRPLPSNLSPADAQLRDLIVEKLGNGSAGRISVQATTRDGKPLPDEMGLRFEGTPDEIAQLQRMLRDAGIDTRPGGNLPDGRKSIRIASASLRYMTDFLPAPLADIPPLGSVPPAPAAAAPPAPVQAAPAAEPPRVPAAGTPALPEIVLPPEPAAPARQLPPEWSPNTFDTAPNGNRGMVANFNTDAQLQAAQRKLAASGLQPTRDFRVVNTGNNKRIFIDSSVPESRVLEIMGEVPRAATPPAPGGRPNTNASPDIQLPEVLDLPPESQDRAPRRAAPGTPTPPAPARPAAPPANLRVTRYVYMSGNNGYDLVVAPDIKTPMGGTIGTDQFKTTIGGATAAYPETQRTHSGPARHDVSRGNFVAFELEVGGKTVLAYGYAGKHTEISGRNGTFESLIIVEKPDQFAPPGERAAYEALKAEKMNGPGMVRMRSMGGREIMVNPTTVDIPNDPANPLENFQQPMREAVQPGYRNRTAPAQNLPAADLMARPAAAPATPAVTAPPAAGVNAAAIDQQITQLDDMRAALDRGILPPAEKDAARATVDRMKQNLQARRAGQPLPNEVTVAQSAQLLQTLDTLAENSLVPTEQAALDAAKVNAARIHSEMRPGAPGTAPVRAGTAPGSPTPTAGGTPAGAAGTPTGTPPGAGTPGNPPPPTPPVASPGGDPPPPPKLPTPQELANAVRGRPIGVGGSALVYEIPGYPDLVVRVSGGFVDPNTNTLKPGVVDRLNPTPAADPFEGRINVGQAVGDYLTDGTARVTVLRRQNGMTARWVDTPGMTREEKTAHLEHSQKAAADLPVEAYRQLIRDSNRLAAMGGKVDPKPTNLLIEPGRGFGFVDVAHLPNGAPGLGAFPLAQMIIDPRTTQMGDRIDSPSLQASRRAIIEKMHAAAMAEGVQFFPEQKPGQPRSIAHESLLRLAGYEGAALNEAYARFSAPPPARAAAVTPGEPPPPGSRPPGQPAPPGEPTPPAAGTPTPPARPDTPEYRTLEETRTAIERGPVPPAEKAQALATIDKMKANLEAGAVRQTVNPMEAANLLKVIDRVEDATLLEAQRTRLQAAKQTIARLQGEMKATGPLRRPGTTLPPNGAHGADGNLHTPDGRTIEVTGPDGRPLGDRRVEIERAARLESTKTIAEQLENAIKSEIAKRPGGAPTPELTLLQEQLGALRTGLNRNILPTTQELTGLIDRTAAAAPGSIDAQAMKQKAGLVPTPAPASAVRPNATQPAPAGMPANAATPDLIAQRYEAALEELRATLEKAVGKEAATRLWTESIPDMKAYVKDIMSNEIVNDPQRIELIEATRRLAASDPAAIRMFIESGGHVEGLVQMAGQDGRYQQFYKEVVTWNQGRATDSNINERARQFWERNPRQYTADILTEPRPTATNPANTNPARPTPAGAPVPAAPESPADIAGRLEVVSRANEDVWRLRDPKTGKEYYAKSATTAEVEMTEAAGKLKMPADSPLRMPNVLTTDPANIPPALRGQTTVGPGRPGFIITEAAPPGVTLLQIMPDARGAATPVNPAFKNKPITAAEADALLRAVRHMNENGVFNHDFNSNTSISRDANGRLVVHAYDFEPGTYQRTARAGALEDFEQVKKALSHMVEAGTASPDVAQVIERHSGTFIDVNAIDPKLLERALNQPGASPETLRETARTRYRAAVAALDAPDVPPELRKALLDPNASNELKLQLLEKYTKATNGSPNFDLPLHYDEIVSAYKELNRTLNPNAQPDIAPTTPTTSERAPAAPASPEPDGATVRRSPASPPPPAAPGGSQTGRTAPASPASPSGTGSFEPGVAPVVDHEAARRAAYNWTPTTTDQVKITQGRIALAEFDAAARRALDPNSATLDSNFFQKEMLDKLTKIYEAYGPAANDIPLTEGGTTINEYIQQFRAKVDQLKVSQADIPATAEYRNAVRGLNTAGWAREAYLPPTPAAPAAGASGPTPPTVPANPNAQPEARPGTTPADEVPLGELNPPDRLSPDARRLLEEAVREGNEMLARDPNATPPRPRTAPLGATPAAQPPAAPLKQTVPIKEGSVITFEDGTTVRVKAERITNRRSQGPVATLELEVTRPGGGSTTVNVRIPPEVGAQVPLNAGGEGNLVPEVGGRLLVTNEGLLYMQTEPSKTIVRTPGAPTSFVDATPVIQDSPGERNLTPRQRFIIDQARAMNNLAKSSPQTLADLGVTPEQIRLLAAEPKTPAEIKAWQENVRAIGDKLKTTGNLENLRTAVNTEIGRMQGAAGTGGPVSTNTPPRPGLVRRVAGMDAGAPGGLLAIAISVPHLIKEWDNPAMDNYERGKNIALLTTGTGQVIGHALEPPRVPPGTAPRVPTAPGMPTATAPGTAGTAAKVSRTTRMFQALGALANPVMVVAGVDAWNAADKVGPDGKPLITSDMNYLAQKGQSGAMVIMGTHGGAQTLLNIGRSAVGRAPMALPGGAAVGAAGMGLLAFTVADELQSAVLGNKKFFEEIELTNQQVLAAKASNEEMSRLLQAGRKQNGIPDILPAQTIDYAQTNSVLVKLAGLGLGKYEDLQKLPPEKLQEKIDQLQDRLQNDFNSRHGAALEEFTRRRTDFLNRNTGGLPGDIADATRFIVGAVSGSKDVERFVDAQNAQQQLIHDLDQLRSSRNEVGRIATRGPNAGRVTTDRLPNGAPSIAERNKKLDDLKKSDPVLAQAIVDIAPIYRKLVKGERLTEAETRQLDEIVTRVQESQLKDMQANAEAYRNAVPGSMSNEDFLAKQRERLAAAGLNTEAGRPLGSLLMIQDAASLENAVVAHNIRGMREMGTTGKSDIKPIDMIADLGMVPQSVQDVVAQSKIDSKDLRMVELPNGTKMLEITVPPNSNLATKLLGHGMEVEVLPGGKIAVPLENLREFISPGNIERLEAERLRHYSGQQDLATQTKNGKMDDFTIAQFEQRAAAMGLELQKPPVFDPGSQTFHIVLRDPDSRNTHPDKEIVLHAKANGESFDVQQVELRRIPGPGQPLVAGTYVRPNPPLSINPNAPDGLRGLPAAVGQVRQTHEGQSKAAFEANPYRKLDAASTDQLIQLRRNEDEIAILERVQKRVEDLEKTQGKGNVRIAQLNLTREEASAVFREPGRQLGDPLGGGGIQFSRYQYNDGRVYLDEYKYNGRDNRDVGEITNLSSDRVAGALRVRRQDQVRLERQFYERASRLPVMPDAERAPMQERHNAMLAELKKMEDALGKDSPLYIEARDTIRARIDMERSGISPEAVRNHTVQLPDTTLRVPQEFSGGNLTRAVNGEAQVLALIQQMDSLPPERRDAALDAAIALNKKAAELGQPPVFGGHAGLQMRLMEKLTPTQRLKLMAANDQLNKIYAEKGMGDNMMLTSKHQDWMIEQNARSTYGASTGMYDYQKQVNALAEMTPAQRAEALAANARVNEDYKKAGMKPPLVDAANMEGLIASHNLTRPEKLYANRAEFEFKTAAAGKLTEYYAHLSRSAGEREKRDNGDPKAKLVVAHRLFVDTENPAVAAVLADIRAGKKDVGAIPVSEEQVVMLRELHAQLKADLASGREVNGVGSPGTELEFAL